MKNSLNAAAKGKYLHTYLHTTYKKSIKSSISHISVTNNRKNIEKNIEFFPLKEIPYTVMENIHVTTELKDTKSGILHVIRW